ncbi:MAG TPA: hypothetical protein PK082_05700 [Phycisphaerae bacterium]|nr:hypothetical protein [Phycisphaerae bacterium]
MGVAAVGAFWLTRKGDADNERDGDSASLPRIHAFQGPQPWEFAVRIEAESIPEDKETEAISEFRSMQTLVRPGEYRGIPVLPVLSPRHNANAAYDPESRKGSVESIHHIQLTGKDDAVFLRLEKFPELAKHPADVKPQGWNDLLLWKENDHDVRFQLLYTDYASVVDGLFRGKVQPDGSIRGTVEGTVFLFHGRLAVARCNIKTGAFSLTAAPDSPDRHMNPFGEPAVAFSGQKTWKLKLAYSVPLKKTFHVPDAQKARQYADLRSTAGGGVTLVNDHRTARLIVMCSPTIRLEGDGRKIFLTCEKACSLPRAPKTALPPETLSFDLWESDQRSICFPLRVRVGSLYLDCVVFGKFDATGKLHAVFDGSVFCPSVGMGQSDRYDLVADGNFSLEPVASAD